MSFMPSSSSNSPSSQRYYRHHVFRSCSEEESTNTSLLESPTKGDDTSSNSTSLLVAAQRTTVVPAGASVTSVGSSCTTGTIGGTSRNSSSATTFPSTRATAPPTIDTNLIRMNDDRSSTASSTGDATTSSLMVQLVPSHSAVYMLRTGDTHKSIRVANSSACCHRVMTSITPRHQEDETISSTTAAPPPIAEEVLIEDDVDARSPSFAIICNGEEEDSQVQDLESVEEQEESDYEYDYEDDDDGHFTGFLASTEVDFQEIAVSNSTNGANIIEDCQQPPPIDTDIIRSELPRQEEMEEKQLTIRKSAWKEPSQAAVTMSLRAERETCGGKRRLASDLYKIMVGDTTEQGFTLEPTNEDSMDTWKIKLFGFDPDSNLQKDMDLLGLDHIELEMTFPDDYPFAPPFVRVVRPRFKRQTGFVMDGALCMELLTSEGWNPVNDIESVIVSIRSLIVVGDGRISAAERFWGEPDSCSSTILNKGDAQLPAAVIPGKISHDAIEKLSNPDHRLHPEDSILRAPHYDRAGVAAAARKENCVHVPLKEVGKKSLLEEEQSKKRPFSSLDVGRYTEAESRSAYSHLSEYHKKKGWSRWWARKG